MESLSKSVAIVAAVIFAAHIMGYFVPIVMFIYNSCCFLWKSFLFLCAGLIALLAGIELEPYVPKRIRREPNDLIVSKTKERLADLKFSPGKVKSTPLVSRNVDDVIEELISLLFRDYISNWYSFLVKRPGLFTKQLKDTIRQMLFTFRDRCQKMDEIELITSDIVNIITVHMQHIRFSVINPSEKTQPTQPYKVYKFLSSEEEELEHLRYLCDFLLVTLLPPEYVSHKTLKCLLREIFTVSVFYPVIDKLCDPDFINMKLISYLKQQQQQAEKHRKTYEYAETYEDFIKMIQESIDIENLRRMRYYIATEIMQATFLSNVKRSRGMDADKEYKPQKTNKGYLLQARDLSRYLNQLQFAKSQCEKRLKLIGGAEYISSKSEKENSNKSGYMPGQKVLSLSVIMQTSFCRRHFSKFLQKEEAHSLLGFWEAVDDMKHSDKGTWHKLGNDIVQIYLHNQSSSVRLNKSTLKGIEEFMMANKGPEAFFQAQEEVYKVLEENYYASFIVSDVYHKMLAEVEKEGIDFMQEMPDDAKELQIPEEDIVIVEKSSLTSDVSVFDHSSYARSQLKLVTEKISDKKQALEALKTNPKCEKRVIVMMEKEIDGLVLEQNMLENHIEKTELWIEYLGVWQATIMEAMEKKENDKLVPYFVIRVHLANDAILSSNKMAGWVVSRNLQSFHSLHQKLVPAASWLKKIDLPTKPRFKSLDRNYLEKAKKSLQIFLSAVTKDDGLNKSEALYDFLSPSPENMKHPRVPFKKPVKFNLLQFLKGTLQNTLSQFDDPVDEELLFLDDSDSKEDKKDSIAEPLYVLIGEIFELKGVFNWLRRSLIIFVQVTYGSTINRQLRETVGWVLSEPMLLFYLQLFRDTMWPPDNQVLNVEERTKEKKLETKLLAKQMFLTNTPMILNKLIGEQNTRKGLSKVFDALQNKYFNKQLFYKILEAFIYKYAPELKQISSLYDIEVAQSCS